MNNYEYYDGDNNDEKKDNVGINWGRTASKNMEQGTYRTRFPVFCAVLPTFIKLLAH